MVPIAHAADYILLVPFGGLLVWLVLTTFRQRREDDRRAATESADHDTPKGERE